MRIQIVAACMMITTGFCLLGGCQSSGRQQDHGPLVIDQPAIPPLPPYQKAVPLDSVLRAEAKAEIIAAFNSTDDELRANAVEAAQDTLGQGARAIIQSGLRDNSYKVRFSACLAAGTLQLKDLHDDVLGLAFDSNPKVLLAGRFALHRMGDKHLSHSFEKTARDPNPRVREDTAFILGLLGDKTALKLLNDMVRDDDVYVRISVAEAQWRLGDDDGLKVLVGGVSSTDIQVRLLTMIALAAPKNDSVAKNLYGQLTADSTIGSPEVALVAARCLGELGYRIGFREAMNYCQATDPRYRALSALAFGAIGESDGQSYLRPLLKDSDARVRLAAATAILELKA